VHQKSVQLTDVTSLGTKFNNECWFWWLVPGDVTSVSCTDFWCTVLVRLYLTPWLWPQHCPHTLSSAAVSKSHRIIKAQLVFDW